jgi:hypothetical protein
LVGKLNMDITMKSLKIALALVLSLVIGTAAAIAFTNGDDVTVSVKGKVVGTLADGRVVVTTPNGPILANPSDVAAATTTTTPTTTTDTTPTQTTPPTTTTPPPTGTLFTDDFTGAAGTKADTTKWVDYGPCNGGYQDWGGIQCGANETLDGSGHLVVPATPSTGSALQTRGKFSATYGTFSAWIKMPSQSGYWPAFWMLNGSQSGSEVQTGETDVVETYTTWSGANSRLHSWNNGEVWESPNILYAQSACLSCAYHKYSVKFSALGTITFYFDDVQVGQGTQSQAGSKWFWGPAITRGNWIILDLAVGGAGQATPSASAQMLVDKVEVTS